MAGDAARAGESLTAASDIYAQVSGEVVAVNEALGDEPELVKNEPYAGGWLFKIKMADSGELKEMLTADQYQEQIDSE